MEWTWPLVGLALVLLFLFIIEELPLTPRYYKMKKIHGPKDLFFFGPALELGSLPLEDLLDWLIKRMNMYPRMMKSSTMGKNVVYMYNPSDIQELVSSVEHIDKGIEYMNLTSWLKEGLLTSTGKKWHERRKLLTPTFHFKILKDSMKTLNKNAKVLCEKLCETQGEPVVVEKYITLCTLDIICESAMGIKLGAQNQEDLEYVTSLKRVTELIMHRVAQPWLYVDFLYWMTKESSLYTKYLSFVHNFTKKVIEDRKNSFSELVDNDMSKNKSRRAFLDCLLEVDSQNPGILSNEDIREEVDTFMFEGHDTTSSALNFIFFNLGTHPALQEKVFTETTEIFGDNAELTMPDLQKMTYLEKVIKESLRIYPSVPLISRLIRKDVHLDNLVIPSRTNVIIATYKLHRDEEYFPDPERFDPERFSEEQVQDRHPFAYLPFSAGPRNCIGQKFAMMELKTIVSSVVRRFRVESLTRRQDIKLVPLLTLKTNRPILCRFIPR